MKKRIIPPPIRAEHPAPDMPRPVGFGIRLWPRPHIILAYDFKSWTLPDSLERAIERGIWI